MSTTTTANGSDVKQLRERVKAAIAAEREHIIEVSETIRVNPELGYEEVMASALAGRPPARSGL